LSPVPSEMTDHPIARRMLGYLLELAEIAKRLMKTG
jgi:hypothetical protein